MTRIINLNDLVLFWTFGGHIERFIFFSVKLQCTILYIQSFNTFSNFQIKQQSTPSLSPIDNDVVDFSFKANDLNENAADSSKISSNNSTSNETGSNSTSKIQVADLETGDRSSYLSTTSTNDSSSNSFEIITSTSSPSLDKGILTGYF